MVVHCTQLIRMKRAGGQGVYDFRGLLIRLGERSGFIFDYDNDWSVLVERTDGMPEGEIMQSWKR